MTFREFIIAKINDVPFFKTLLMHLEKTDEKGSTIRISYDERHKNIWGNVHGGSIASLVDATCGLSIAPFLGDDEYIMTAGLQVQFLVPVKSGDLVGRGNLVYRGKRLAYAEANIFDEQEHLIAKGYASFAIMTGKIYKRRNANHSLLSVHRRRR